MLRLIAAISLLTISASAGNGPVREASTSAIVGRLMPGFYNGYLYSCEPSHVVTLFAPDGHITLTLPIQGRGNRNVKVLAVAIDADGTLAIGWADPPNAGIDLRDTFGNLIRSIETGRYMPAHLSFGPDRSLWSFGLQRGTADYLTVRKYSFEGNEKGAYLPRSLFPQGLEPGMEAWQARQITVTGDRVGIEAISGTVSNRREWIELDLNGKLTGRWRLDQSIEFPGVALTSDNQAFIHRYNRAEKSRQVYRLNRTLSIWETVNAPHANLYGADGDKLVFAEWSDGPMHMSWFPQP